MKGTTHTAPRQNLKDQIRFMNEEQAQFILDFIQAMGGLTSKNDLLRLTYNEAELKKIDSAFPISYQDKARENNIPLASWSHFYDYNANTYGELKNIAEELILKASKMF